MKSQGYKKLYKELFQEWKQTDMEGNEFISCVACGTRIYSENVSVNNFAHVKSKGSHPELKYDKGNVVCKCHFCHLTEHTKGVVHNYTGIK